MATIPVDELKQAHRATWAAGDYAAVADAITDELVPALLIERAGLEPGQEVLDVATGPGNVALKAAAAGSRATGLDLTPELLATARSRADAAGLDVAWVEGDAEALPFPGGAFDRVFSAFGIQFAPRHELVAAELARVCRPGGAIALANWTPEGAIGDVFRVLGGYLPASPPFASPPPLWGSEPHVRALFADTGVEVVCERATTPLRFDSGERFVSFMETCYGPMLKARERLTADGRWNDCRAELASIFERRLEHGADGPSVAAEYLVVLGRKEPIRAAP